MTRHERPTTPADMLLAVQQAHLFIAAVRARKGPQLGDAEVERVIAHLQAAEAFFEELDRLEEGRAPVSLGDAASDVLKKLAAKAAFRRSAAE